VKDLIAGHNWRTGTPSFDLVCIAGDLLDMFKPVTLREPIRGLDRSHQTASTSRSQTPETARNLRTVFSSQFVFIATASISKWL
jgi:hypothetical protein